MTGDKPRRSERAVKRRKYLLGIGTALTVSLAGCPASSETGDGSTTGTTKMSPTESASPTPRAETTTETPTATPTPTPTATEQSPTPATEETGNPKQLIREFYAAADSGNFQRANSLVHPDSPEGTISETQQRIFEKQEIDIQGMTVVDESTDRATVQTTLVFTRDGRERTRTTDLELRTHDGAWRLYSVN
jgi:glucose/arabinose dehydrogenase